METSTITYNVLMAIADVAVLLLLARKRTFANWFVAMSLAGMAALALAFVLELDPRGLHFGMIRLAAWGVFLHGTLLMIASAVIFSRKNRPMAIATGLAALVLPAICIDAFLIEPTWLEVTRVQIASEKIQRPLRIVVLADLQTDQFGDYERMVFRRAMEEKPDMILLAGDYLQIWHKPRAKLAKEMNAYLREIGFSAPEGVFAVQGNVDHAHWDDLFDGLETVDVWDSASFEVAGIQLSCLSLGDSNNPGLKLGNESPDRFHIVLGHIPDYALGQINADLLIGGHTHGGQVRLPLVGPIITHSRLPNSWTAGMTDLPSGARLIVSRGLGMERSRAPRLRFLCRPELVVIELLEKMP